MGGRGGNSRLSAKQNKQYTYDELIRGLYYHDKKEDPVMRMQYNKIVHKNEFDKALSDVISEFEDRNTKTFDGIKIDSHNKEIVLMHLRGLVETHEKGFYTMDYHTFIRKKAGLLSGGDKVTLKALQKIYRKMSKMINK